VRKSPTVFTDELKWAQLSRGIAETGHAALRGEARPFGSLYSYLIAPAWWIDSTASAYATIKYLNAIVMASASIPVFFLARRLVSPTAAAIAALGTMCTSALFYAAFLLPEVLAYPTFALFALVAFRSLAGDGRRWNVPAAPGPRTTSSGEHCGNGRSCRLRRPGSRRSPTARHAGLAEL